MFPRIENGLWKGKYIALANVCCTSKLRLVVSRERVFLGLHLMIRNVLLWFLSMKNNKKTSSSHYYPPNYMKFQLLFLQGKWILPEGMADRGGSAVTLFPLPLPRARNWERTDKRWDLWCFPRRCWWLPHSAPIPCANMMCCIPLESERGIFPSLLEFEPIFQGYVLSVPACVLLLLSLQSVLLFPKCVYYSNTSKEERGWLGAVGVTGCSGTVRLGLCWYYLVLSAL